MSDPEFTVGRFPAGTDPRHAAREVLDFHFGDEIPWWLRADVTWWHGSRDGIRIGETIVPPALSGVMPHIEGSDPNSVYVTRNRADAVMYACWHRSPMLYEVTFHVEPSEDDVLDDPDSFRVPQATVRKVHGITEFEARRALNRVFGAIEE